MKYMKKVFKSALLFLSACMIYMGCGSNGSESVIESATNTSASACFSNSGIEATGYGMEVKNGVLYISQGGSYEITGESDNGAIVIDTEEEVTLRLKGITLTNTTGPAILCENAELLTIYLEEGTENILTDGSDYQTDDEGNAIGKGVIFSNDSLVFDGDGSLVINGNYKHGIVSDDEVSILSGKYTITAVKDGIHANDLVTIDGGEFTISAGSDIIGSGVNLIINDGYINGESDDEGLEGKTSVYINGGTIEINVVDDGLNAGEKIEINDGNINISTQTGDAIDCNGSSEGSITINGGYVYAKGGSAPEGAIDNDNTAFVINGGTLIGIGAVNSPISESSTQPAIVYGSFEEGKTISIVDEDGNVVFEITPSVSGTTMIISAPEIKTGNTYTIKCDGEDVMTVTADSMQVDAGGSAEGMGGMGNMGGKGQRGEMSEDFDPSQMGEAPEGFDPSQMGEAPEGFDPSSNGERPEMPDGMTPPSNSKKNGN